MDKPQNSEKISNNQEYYDRLKFLSGIPLKEEILTTDKKQLNEGIVYTPELIKDSIKKASDGKNYSIIRENHKYFIKTATGTKTPEQLDESDFVFVGGLGNKHQYRYNSLAEAQKQFNFIMKSLNEAYNWVTPHIMKEEGKVKEVKEQVIGGADEEDKEEEPVAAEPLAEPEAGLSEPSPEVSAEPVGDTVPAGPEAGLEEPVAGEPEGIPAGPEGEVSPESSDDLGGEEGLGDDLGGGLEDDPIQLVQSLKGKLAQKIRATELTPETTKDILNSIISALDLQQVDPDERLAIARKVKKGGSAEQEIELQEDFGDKVKGTQPMGKGKVKDIAGGGTTEKKKSEFGKSAKGTQAMGKGKLKMESVESIENLVKEALSKFKKPVVKQTVPEKKPIVSETKNRVFTSDRSDLKRVESLIESVLKKKSLVQKEKV